jgi:phosphatidylinositol 4-kinase type 2
MERLDRVEEGLKRLGRGEDEEEDEEVLFEEEDEDAESTPLMKEPVTAPAVKAAIPPSQPSASTSTAGSTLVNGDIEGATVGTKPRLSGLGAAAANRPSVRMSEDSGSKSMHVRWASHGAHEGRSGRSMDVSRTPFPMDGTGSGTKTVIAEVSLLHLIGRRHVLMIAVTARRNGRS